MHSMRGEEFWKIGVRAHPIQTPWCLLYFLIVSIELGLDPQGCVFPVRSSADSSLLRLALSRLVFDSPDCERNVRLTVFISQEVRVWDLFQCAPIRSRDVLRVVKRSMKV
jgi:hypothetical protein